MAARRYEISLRVLRTSEIFFNTRREISYLQAAMLCSIYYINTNEIPNHFTFCCERRDLLCNHSNGDLLTCEDNMLFSRVRISCFRTKAHLVFYIYIYIFYSFATLEEKFRISARPCNILYVLYICIIYIYIYIHTQGTKCGGRRWGTTLIYKLYWCVPL